MEICISQQSSHDEGLSPLNVKLMSKFERKLTRKSFSWPLFCSGHIFAAHCIVFLSVYLPTSQQPSPLIPSAVDIFLQPIVLYFCLSTYPSWSVSNPPLSSRLLSEFIWNPHIRSNPLTFLHVVDHFQEFLDVWISSRTSEICCGSCHGGQFSFFFFFFFFFFFLFVCSAYSSWHNSPACITINFTNLVIACIGQDNDLCTQKRKNVCKLWFWKRFMCYQHWIYELWNIEWSW